MIKAFLSHSSTDKESYIRIVANNLGDNNCVYDEYTFEFGLKPIEEIIRGLEISQLFVVFLSEKSLASDWVQKELLLAHEKLKSKDLERIFPIIIDPNLTYFDSRIPQWMKDEYNLKYVSRPTIAARRIRQRLREISWMYNPRLRERDQIFVGRNDLIKFIEERIDDFDKEFPTCIMATGLPQIGRYSLLRNALVKSNVVRRSYEFPSIVLRREESLEDLIIKLFDLGFSQIPYPTDLMSIDIDLRLDIAEKIIKDVQHVKEIILIRDEGCIINYTRRIQPWFDELLRRVSKKDRVTFIISARYRPVAKVFFSKPYIFLINVPELSFNERKGLFKRIIEFEDIALTSENFLFFSGLFQGFPDQVLFASDMIRDFGILDAKKEAYQLTEFNSDRAATILRKYDDQPKTLEILRLLSEFEFISFDFLFSLIDESEHYSLLNDFISTSICDYVGIEKEFIRINDAIRDYVRRIRLFVPDVFKEKLNQHLEAFINSPDEEERDISDLSYSIKESIKTGRVVRNQYLIPSHFLKSIRELYQARGHWDRVIELADKLLEKEHLLDQTIAQDIRYYLCLSLARKRDPRMLSEVQKISGVEHNFLLGFYYRLQGRPDDAIKRLLPIIDDYIVSSRARRELVQNYIIIEEYESALSLAKLNYEENRRNPFHIQAYFNTLINSRNVFNNKDLLSTLLEELDSIRSDMSAEMAQVARAEFLAKCENDYDKAIDLLNDAIGRFRDPYYPLMSKATLAIRNRDLENLKSSFEKLEKMSKKRSIPPGSLIRFKAYIIALKDTVENALDYATANLNKIPMASRQKFLQRLNEYN